jgi:glyoxylase-like metal-dependent hydrolase (beta-lactamase superfamily II)
MYHEGTTNFPFSFVLAQRGDCNVLVDTGFMQEDHRSGFSLKFGIPTWISPVRMLREMKLAPEAITDIVITHAHFDHMGSIAEFPNAHIYPEERASFLVRSLRASVPLRSSHRNRRPRQYSLGA